MKLVIKLSNEEIEQLSKGEEVRVDLCRMNYEDLDGAFIRKREE